MVYEKNHSVAHIICHISLRTQYQAPGLRSLYDIANESIGLIYGIDIDFPILYSLYIICYISVVKWQKNCPYDFNTNKSIIINQS